VSSSGSTPRTWPYEECSPRRQYDNALSAAAVGLAAADKEPTMKAVLLPLHLFGALMMPVSDRVPELNIHALCKARSAGDVLMRLPESQPVADCVRDEEGAKQKLSTLWPNSSRAVRKRCESDAASLGTRSYLDLLVCMQMADDIKTTSPIDSKKHRR
jgi:hypothetical protein